MKLLSQAQSGCPGSAYVPPSTAPSTTGNVTARKLLLRGARRPPLPMGHPHPPKSPSSVSLLPPLSLTALRHCICVRVLSLRLDAIAQGGPCTLGLFSGAENGAPQWENVCSCKDDDRRVAHLHEEVWHLLPCALLNHKNVFFSF